MGDVYRARYTRLKGEVAIKVLPEAGAHIVRVAYDRGLKEDWRDK